MVERINQQSLLRAVPGCASDGYLNCKAAHGPFLIRDRGQDYQGQAVEDGKTCCQLFGMNGHLVR